MLSMIITVLLPLIPYSNLTSVSAVSGNLTFYISPDGDDSGVGTKEDPWGSFDHAISMLSPGDTLVLLDGTYDDDNTGYISYDCSNNAPNGTEANPITIKAENERQAWIDGDGSENAIRIIECSYINIDGIYASHGDYPDGESQIIRISKSDHINVKRVLLNHANRYENSNGIGIQLSNNVLIEEAEVYDFHRHGISAYQSENVIIRRSYVNGRQASDVSGGHGSHGCCKNGGDEGFSFYFTSNSIVENSISVNSEGLSIIAGIETVLGNPGGTNNQMLGTISYKDLRASFVQSRKFAPHQNMGPHTGPADNTLIKDFLVVGGEETTSFTPRASAKMTIEGATWINSKLTPMNTMPASQSLNNRPNYFQGCDNFGGCDFDISNVLYLDNSYTSEAEASGALLLVPEHDDLDFVLEYSNAWSSSDPELGFNVAEDIADDSGKYQNSGQIEPTAMGLEQGKAIVFVPEISNMSGAGKDGADIGANILYRYVDGELTDEPLWDPITGEFPRGAIVAGVNDVPGDSLFDIHQQLNVNYNGVTLPYNETNLNETVTVAKEVIAAADIGEEVHQHPQSAVDTLEAAIEAAEALIADGSVTEATFGEAVTTLNEAIEAFNNHVNELQTGGLEQAITAANELVSEDVAGDEPGDYPQVAVDELETVIADAKAVLADDDAEQAEVDAAVSALNQAVVTFETAVIPEPTLTGVEANQDDVLLEIDEAFDLAVKAVFTDESSADVTAEASYSSSDESVVAVTNQGALQAVSAGSAQITIAYEGKTTIVAVKVYSTTIQIGEAVAVVPGEIFIVEGSSASIKMPDDLPAGTTVTVVKVTDIEHAGYEVAGDVYTVEFTNPNGTTVEGSFTLTLGYDADTYDADDVSIFYYNEETEAWEEQGGVVADGVITLDVPHFSTYGVFAEEDPAGSPNENEDDSPGADNDQDELPDTATSTYNWMLAGVILLGLGLAFTAKLRRNRIKE